MTLKTISPTITPITELFRTRWAAGLVTPAWILATFSLAFAGGYPPCILPDNGTGTVTLPDPDCSYVSPDDFHNIVNGLPPGSTILITAVYRDFVCQEPGIPQELCNSPGGSLGGEVETFDAILDMEMVGMGDLEGFVRSIDVPISCVVEAGPRVPGDPVQSFPTELVQLQGAIYGDLDFDILAIRAGRNYGLNSPGHTTLTRENGVGDDFLVDSYFDVLYEIDFQGASGSVLAGMGGTTQGAVRMVSAGPGPVATTPESWGRIKSIYR
jgi:hypothetical protein